MVAARNASQQNPKRHLARLAAIAVHTREFDADDLAAPLRSLLTRPPSTPQFGLRDTRRPGPRRDERGARGGHRCATSLRSPADSSGSGDAHRRTGIAGVFSSGRRDSRRAKLQIGRSRLLDGFARPGRCAAQPGAVARAAEFVIRRMTRAPPTPPPRSQAGGHHDRACAGQRQARDVDSVGAAYICCAAVYFPVRLAQDTDDTERSDAVKYRPLARRAA